MLYEPIRCSRRHFTAEIRSDERALPQQNLLNFVPVRMQCFSFRSFSHCPLSKDPFLGNVSPVSIFHFTRRANRSIANSIRRIILRICVTRTKDCTKDLPMANGTDLILYSFSFFFLTSERGFASKQRPTDRRSSFID